jgi:hypothetical protein
MMIQPKKDKEEKRHPHADAEYTVFEQQDKTFGVRITVPDAYPATITSFMTETAATQWIAAHKEKVSQRPDLRRPRVPDFGRSRAT